MTKKNIILIVGVIAVAGIGYYFWNKNRKKNAESDSDNFLRLGDGGSDSVGSVVKSAEQYIAEQTARCTNNDKAMLALRNGYYVPEHEAWARFGYDANTELCELLGWMQEIKFSQDKGVKWEGVETMAGRAQGAAYQLARQKGRA
jgi:hypothetical protein